MVVPARRELGRRELKSCRRAEMSSRMAFGRGTAAEGKEAVAEGSGESGAERVRSGS